MLLQLSISDETLETLLPPGSPISSPNLVCSHLIRPAIRLGSMPASSGIGYARQDRFKFQRIVWIDAWNGNTTPAGSGFMWTFSCPAKRLKTCLIHTCIIRQFTAVSYGWPDLAIQDYFQYISSGYFCKGPGWKKIFTLTQCGMNFVVLIDAMTFITWQKL